MDPYDSQTPQGGERRPASGGTPIYDRLVAEWQAAGGRHPLSEPHGGQDPPCGGFVPAARTSDEGSGPEAPGG
ncbi:hypothetical protein [Streptomyces sp. VB1]|uniref:hypothetical protein n=1 Tax=Streptomyces sp. VB1 TaxID=2986803 RepID=UPI0022429FEE|nr:hypothetical protein [Streptomyces sp. VB1]UZI27713.1 hypothetical protein OH133_05975 [Streptomyces sp. VB1]